MPFESSVAAPTVQWDVVVHWPLIRRNFIPLNQTLADVVMGHVSGTAPTSNSEALNQQLVGEEHAAGVVASESMWMEDDTYCWAYRQLVPAGHRNLKFGGWPGMPLVKLTDANMTAGSRMPSFRRVWWCQFLFKMECVGGNLGIDNGVAMTEESGPWGTAPWFNRPFGQQPGGFGFIGNSLGTGFDYISMTPQVAAPAGIIEQVPVPPAVAPMGQWNLAEFLVINSAPGRQASMVASMNGVPIVTRNWAAGPGQLPAYGVRNTHAVGYALRTQLEPPGGAVNASLFIGGLEIRMGRFTPDGLEITS